MTDDVFVLVLAVALGKSPHEIESWPRSSLVKLRKFWSICGPQGITRINDTLDSVNGIKYVPKPPEPQSTDEQIERNIERMKQ